MALIYQSDCSHCGTTAQFCGSYLAIRLDAVPSDRTPHALDGQIVPLHHPGESREIESLGYSFEQAANEGRLSRFYAVFCTNCGTRFEQRVFVPPNRDLVGCLPSLLLAMTVAYFVHTAWPHLLVVFLTFMLTAIASLLFVNKLAGKLRRARYADIITEVERVLPCPRCDSEDFQTASLRIKSGRCPDCDQMHLSVSAVAIS